MYESSHWLIGRELEALRLESFITEIASGGQGVLVIEDPLADGQSLFLQKHLPQFVQNPVEVILALGEQDKVTSPGYILLGLSQYIAEPGPWAGAATEQAVAELAKLFSLIGSERRPLLLVVENFQWADALTKQVIKTWLEIEAGQTKYFGIILCGSGCDCDDLSFLNKELLADCIKLRPYTAEVGDVQVTEGESSDATLPASLFRHFSEINKMQQVLQQKNKELMAAEKKAQQASKAKSVFLANMSHEIRTPLNGVMGTISLLQSTPLTAEQKTLLEALETSSENLYRIVNDILDLSKIEAGQQTLQTESIWLSELILQCYDLFRGSAEKKNLSFSYDISKIDNLKVIGDSLRIRQILSNLINNAIKFTEAGSVVVSGFSSVFADHIKYRFEVSDTGVGIAEEDLKKLFQNFSQLDDSSKKKAPGTGLGLSICQKLVELMGGEIGLQSEKGKGSTFWFEVKLKRELDLPTKSLQPKQELNFKWDKLRILVAEDNKVNQMIIQKMLEGLKCDVVITENGEKFIEQIKSANYDLAFLDCQMPVVDGFDACKKLRSEKIKTPPIIALTAYALSSDRQRCLEAGMDDYLSKPVNGKLIKEMIEKWYRPNMH